MTYKIYSEVVISSFIFSTISKNSSPLSVILYLFRVLGSFTNKPAFKRSFKSLEIIV